jgi:hypothetical protein
MRKITIIILLMCFLSACSSTKVIDGTEYDTYGLLNQSTKQNPNIEYEVVWGNVFWGIVLFETIITPIYFFGFDLFQPIGKNPPIKGQVIR